MSYVMLRLTLLGTGYRIYADLAYGTLQTWDRLWCACVHDDVGLRIVMGMIWCELGTETSPRAV